MPRFSYNVYVIVNGKPNNDTRVTTRVQKVGMSCKEGVDETVICVLYIH